MPFSERQDHHRIFQMEPFSSTFAKELNGEQRWDP